VRFTLLPRRRSHRAFALLLVVLVPLVLGLERRSLLRAAGRSLVADEPVVPSDVVVVPEWVGAAGAIDAADLVRAGIASRVAVIGAAPRAPEMELARRHIPHQSETDDVVQLLHRLGVRDVEVIGIRATGTESEGEVLSLWCEQRGVRSIVVVSGPDHGRRLRRVLRRSMRGHGTRVAIRSARFSDFDPDTWWETRDGLRSGIVELEKLLLDVVRHPLS
jgi:hypothetical protein